jgi:simple sugar transport system ATP-binding protein
VRAEALTAKFGDFTALDDVSLSLKPGAIHALVGQNGAGKTTFARAITGLLQLTRGSVRVLGNEVAGSSASARRAGIDMVHQSFTLPPSLTVSEAFELFLKSTASLRPYRKSKLDDYWQSRMSSIGVNVDPKAVVGTLPVEVMQSLEIGRVLASQARVMVLDEPTAVLAPPAVERLFERLRVLAKEGLTIIVVLHKIREVFSIADTISVLRNGKLILGSVEAAEVSPDQLRAAVVGEAKVVSNSSQPQARAGLTAPADRPLLSLRDVSTAEKLGDAAVQSMSFDVREGEVLGVAGVEGNGQRSLVEVIIGQVPAGSGSIELNGTEVANTDTATRRRLGLRVVPFERRIEGVAQSRPLWENTAVGWLVAEVGQRQMQSYKRLKQRAETILKSWSVKYQSVDQSAGELSGGNMQRLILGRELDDSLQVLVAANPARGLDISATDFVHQAIRRLCDEGKGVLLVSNDLDELFELSNRIVVVSRGRSVGVFERPFDLNKIGNAMLGNAETVQS